MFVTALFVQALLATAALGIPSPKDRFEQRMDRRAAAGALDGARQTVPAKLLDTQGTPGGGEAHPEYSSNWAGVVLAKPAVSALPPYCTSAR